MRTRREIQTELPENSQLRGRTAGANVYPPSDDDAWEDITERTKSPARSGAGSTTGTANSSATRRRRTRNIIYVAAAPRRSVTALTSPQEKRFNDAQPKDVWAAQKAQAVDLLAQCVWFMLQYIRDVLVTTIRHLRAPLSLLLIVYALLFIVGRATRSLQVAVTPLCSLPIVSHLPFCEALLPQRDVHISPALPRRADFPKLTEIQSETLGKLLKDTIGGSALSLDIKKAEMATSDLATVVRYSNLASRDLLADKLLEFVQQAKKTGRGLQRMSSKLGGVVDSIMAMNDYALHTIEGAASKSSFAMILWPFPANGQNEVVMKTFTQTMDLVSSSIEQLIVEAETNLIPLYGLEQVLSTIRDIISRENTDVSVAREKLLAELWTILGGNKHELHNFERNLYLLGQLENYRKQALAHVASALQTLQAMSEDMEDLRTRTVAPQLTDGKIPVEVHLKSIRRGVERLKESMVEAKKREERAFRNVLPAIDHDR